ncbi:hypothetical protein Golomagni_04392 [Golovinomyces magnicellulatus]|nr:hypothetical protein Golomagni_04392 [Golovinomyces magnicellulatus]
MSTFSIPQNVPSFSDPRRDKESRVWASGAKSRPGVSPHNDNGFLGRLQQRIGDFFEANRDLPMYKDKPYIYLSSKRQRPVWKRKRTLGTGVLLFLLLIYILTFSKSSHKNATAKNSDNSNLISKSEKDGSVINWLDRREEVKKAFILSWDAYSRYAWGKDQFHPITKEGEQMTSNGLGWMIVDALDTLILMNLTSQLVHAREWISSSLNYNQDQEVNTFETTIRMLGGLLSAHYLSTQFPDMAPISDDDEGADGEDLYFEKAKDLADRLIGAFDSPSGIPFASVNLRTSAGIPSHEDGGASSTAEAATLQLEFKYLAKLTGEEFYWKAAEKVIKVIDDNDSQDGLVPIYIYAHNGHFRGENIRLGSRGDSYYEYLVKQYLQTSKEEPIYKEMWDEALTGIRKNLITYSKPSRFTVLGEKPAGLSGNLLPKMDHLVCFMPGAIALAVTEGISESEAKKLPTWTPKKDEEMRLARELLLTCWGMYKVTATGLAPEITHFEIENPPLTEAAPHNPPQELINSEGAEWKKDFVIKNNDKHNLQRPETIESIFYLWRITGDFKYREWGWEMFQSFMEHTAVNGGAGGFSSLSNVDSVPPVTRDNMESFWLAETLKYFYLLFSPNDLLPLDKVVLNTEAHPFPRFHMEPLFKTGWKRKQRSPGNMQKPVLVETTTLEVTTETTLPT